MKRHIVNSLIAVSMVLGSGIPTALAGTTTTVAKAPSGYFKTTISVNGKTVSQPYSLTAKDGNTVTSYVPIWYVNKVLDSHGYKTSWNGKTLSISSGSQGQTPPSSIGSGNTSVVVDGTPIKKLNTIERKDPASGTMTTYFPIFYAEQIFKALGITVNWNGAKELWSMQTPVVLKANAVYGPKTGTETVNNNVWIGGNDSTLQNVTVNGNVYVNPGSSGTAYLNNVKVTGQIIVLSGATQSIHLTNVTAPKLTVNSSSRVHIVTAGKTSVKQTQIASTDKQSVSLDQQSGSLGAVTVSAIASVQLEGTTAFVQVTITASANVVVASGASVQTVNVSGASASVSVSDNASVGNLQVASNDAQVTVDPNAAVSQMVVAQTATNVQVSNNGTISTLQNNASSTSGITVTGNGQVAQTTGNPFSNTSTGSSTSSTSNSGSSTSTTTGSDSSSTTTTSTGGGGHHSSLPSSLISTTNSTLTSDSTTVMAETPVTFKLNLQDDNGNAVTGLANDINVTATSNTTVSGQVSAVTELVPGVYSFTVTPDSSEILTVNASITDPVSNQPIQFTASPINVYAAYLSAQSPYSIVGQPTTFVLRVMDPKGNPVTGLTITPYASSSTATVGNISTLPDGSYAFNVTDSQAEQYSVKATIDSIPGLGTGWTGSPAQTVKPVNQGPVNGVVNVSPISVSLSPGQEQVISFTAVDSDGNPVSNGLMQLEFDPTTANPLFLTQVNGVELAEDIGPNGPVEPTPVPLGMAPSNNMLNVNIPGVISWSFGSNAVNVYMDANGNAQLTIQAGDVPYWNSTLQAVYSSNYSTTGSTDVYTYGSGNNDSGYQVYFGENAPSTWGSAAQTVSNISVKTATPAPVNGAVNMSPVSSTLSPGQLQDISYTVVDSNGNPVPNGLMQLQFDPTTSNPLYLTQVNGVALQGSVGPSGDSEPTPIPLGTAPSNNMPNVVIPGVVGWSFGSNAVNIYAGTNGNVQLTVQAGDVPYWDSTLQAVYSSNYSTTGSTNVYTYGSGNNDSGYQVYFGENAPSTWGSAAQTASNITW